MKVPVAVSLRYCRVARALLTSLSEPVNLRMDPLEGPVKVSPVVVVIESTPLGTLSCTDAVPDVLVTVIAGVMLTVEPLATLTLPPPVMLGSGSVARALCGINSTNNADNTNTAIARGLNSFLKYCLLVDVMLLTLRLNTIILN